MKKIISSIVIITILALQTSCASGKQKDISSTATNADSTANVNPLSTVFTAYLDLKNALAKDDGAAASDAAKVLFKEIDKLPMDKLSKEQHTAWMKYMDKLSYDAEHIKGTTDIDHQREHFMSLSKNMYAVAKAFGTNTADLYYQYCPMANDGKGAYWLSADQKISNPYLGKKMPSCGSTKETISHK